MSTALIRLMFFGLLVVIGFGAPLSQAAAEGHGYGKKIADVTGTVDSVQHFPDKSVVSVHGQADPIGKLSFTATFNTSRVYGGNGHYSAEGRMYTVEGRSIPFFDNGIWKSLATKGQPEHKWLVKTILLDIDGKRSIGIGTFDLETRSVSAKIYELDAP